MLAGLPRLVYKEESPFGVVSTFSRACLSASLALSSLSCGSDINNSEVQLLGNGEHSSAKLAEQGWEWCRGKIEQWGLAGQWKGEHEKWHGQ